MKRYILWDNEKRKTVVDYSGNDLEFDTKNEVVRAILDLETAEDPAKTAGFGERYSWLMKAERPEPKR